jgi:hypothetical protein
MRLKSLSKIMSVFRERGRKFKDNTEEQDSNFYRNPQHAGHMGGNT